jgi:hypothetical protein
MAPPLLFQPEEARSSAQRMRHLSADAQEQHSIATQRWARLNGNWRSYARADVDSLFTEAQRELERMALLFAQLALALDRSTEQLLESDRQAAALFAQDRPVSSRPTPLPNERGGLPPGAPPQIGMPGWGAPPGQRDVPPPGVPPQVGMPGWGTPPDERGRVPGGPGRVRIPVPPSPPPADSGAGHPPPRASGPMPPTAPEPLPPAMAIADAALRDFLNTLLPDEVGSEEFIMLKLTERISLLPLFPILLQHGAQLMIRRRPDGSYEISVRGEASGQLGTEMPADGVVGAGGKVENSFRLIFDPNKPGDLSAMGAFLMTAGLQTTFGQNPFGPLLNQFGPKDPRLNWIDNVQSYVQAVGVGAGVKVNGIVIDARADGHLLVGSGMQIMPDGKPAPITVISEKVGGKIEVKGLNPFVGNTGRLEEEVKVTVAHTNPPVTTVEIRVKAGAGQSITLPDGLPVDFAAQPGQVGGEVTLRINLTGDPQAIVNQVTNGSIDIGQLQSNGMVVDSSLRVSEISDGSLEASGGIPPILKIIGEIGSGGIVEHTVPITLPGQK